MAVILLSPSQVLRNSESALVAILTGMLLTSTCMGLLMVLLGTRRVIIKRISCRTTVNKLVFILACLEGNLALKSNLNESSKFEEPEKKSDQFFVTGVMKNSTGKGKYQQPLKQIIRGNLNLGEKAADFALSAAKGLVKMRIFWRSTTWKKPLLQVFNYVLLNIPGFCYKFCLSERFLRITSIFNSLTSVCSTSAKSSRSAVTVLPKRDSSSSFNVLPTGFSRRCTIILFLYLSSCGAAASALENREAKKLVMFQHETALVISLQKKVNSMLQGRPTTNYHGAAFGARVDDVLIPPQPAIIASIELLGCQKSCDTMTNGSVWLERMMGKSAFDQQQRLFGGNERHLISCLPLLLLTLWKMMKMMRATDLVSECDLAKENCTSDGDLNQKNEKVLCKNDRQLLSAGCLSQIWSLQRELQVGETERKAGVCRNTTEAARDQLSIQPKSERCHVFKLLCRNLPCLLLIVFILIQSVDADAVSVPEKTNTLHGSTFFKETSFVSHLENDKLSMSEDRIDSPSYRCTLVRRIHCGAEFSEELAGCQERFYFKLICQFQFLDGKMDKLPEEETDQATVHPLFSWRNSLTKATMARATFLPIDLCPIASHWFLVIIVCIAFYIASVHCAKLLTTNDLKIVMGSDVSCFLPCIFGCDVKERDQQANHFQGVTEKKLGSIKNLTNCRFVGSKFADIRIQKVSGVCAAERGENESIQRKKFRKILFRKTSGRRKSLNKDFAKSRRPFMNRNVDEVDRFRGHSMDSKTQSQKSFQDGATSSNKFDSVSNWHITVEAISGKFSLTIPIVNKWLNDLVPPSTQAETTAGNLKTVILLYNSQSMDIIHTECQLVVVVDLIEPNSSICEVSGVCPTENEQCESFQEIQESLFFEKLRMLVALVEECEYAAAEHPFTKRRFGEQMDEFRGDPVDVDCGTSPQSQKTFYNETMFNDSCVSLITELEATFGPPGFVIPMDNEWQGDEDVNSTGCSDGDENLLAGSGPKTCFLVPPSETRNARTSAGNLKTVKLPYNRQSLDILIHTECRLVMTVALENDPAQKWIAHVVSKRRERRSARTGGLFVSIVVIRDKVEDAKTAKSKWDLILMNKIKLERSEFVVIQTERAKVQESVKKAIIDYGNELKQHRFTTEKHAAVSRLYQRIHAIHGETASLAEIGLVDLAKEFLLEERTVLSCLQKVGLIWFGVSDEVELDAETEILIDLSSPEKYKQRILSNTAVIKQIFNGGYVKKSRLMPLLTRREKLILSYLEYTGYFVVNGDYFVVPHKLHPRVLREEPDQTTVCRLEPLLFKVDDLGVLPLCVFYDVALGALQKDRSGPALLSGSEFLLRVEALHELKIMYRKSHLAVVIYVHTNDRTLRTTKSGEIAAKAREDIWQLFESICHKTFGEETCVRIGIEAFSGRGSQHDPIHRFIELTSLPFESKDLQEAFKGSLPDSLYTWFNEKPPKSNIQLNFSTYSEALNSLFDDIMSNLICERFLTAKEVSKIYAPPDNRARINILLSHLMSRGKSGDAILEDLLPGQERHGASVTTSTPAASTQTPSHLSQKGMQSLGESSRFESIQQNPIARSAAESYQQYPAQMSNVHPVEDTGSPDQPQPVFGSRSTSFEPRSRLTRRGLENLPEASYEPAQPITPSQPLVPTQSPSSSQAKQDPPVSPIFEAKYYHVERASDYFNERPFKEGGKRLGSGSFGTVYHGVLHSENGEKFEVAIKRLKKASSLNPAQIELSRKQFGVEMNILTRYCYKNIIGLVGFSSDGPELCLIYEFMPNGALSHRLDCRDNTPPLRWQTRLTVSADIASGLDFLHNKYRLPVIHRDVKSSNVLLSSTFQAKLSDFGLAIVGNADGEADSTGPSVGTRPYMGPEVFHKIVTPLGDVYGFGMILYELSTGLPPYSSKKKQDLKSYVDAIESQGIDLTKMLDPKAKWPKTKNELYGLELLTIAKRATEDNYRQRPGVSTLLLDLNQLNDKARRN